MTRREREVVSAVARGMTNREIAGAFFIAEKTVEMHVSNSLSKLGFRSRAQLAAWAAVRGGEHATATG
ncbi:MAG: LuxR C-terminal-related transcriptional regulator [Chloroflexota bacterium]|nr:LuxR C-terminal-related transcriptional regulator [Chloroflexota bacterium]